MHQGSFFNSYRNKKPVVVGGVRPGSVYTKSRYGHNSVEEITEQRMKEFLTKVVEDLSLDEVIYDWGSKSKEKEDYLVEFNPRLYGRLGVVSMSGLSTHQPQRLGQTFYLQVSKCLRSLGYLEDDGSPLFQCKSMKAFEEFTSSLDQH